MRLRTGKTGKLLIVFLMMGLAVLCAAQFAGGSGTEADPWQIETAEHLDNVRNYLEAHFRQTADINLGVAPWNEGEGWEPIGNNSTHDYFSGVYDGGGFIIRNLTINRPNSSFIGLFGIINSSTIKNLGLENVNITGDSGVGAFAGFTNASNVLNRCYVTGRISGNEVIGGFAGSSIITSFENCYITDAVVRGNNKVGGFIGLGEYIEISNCYSAATVVAAGTGHNIRIGGFVSYATYSWEITNSYILGSVVTKEEIGHIGSFVGLSSHPSAIYPDGNIFTGNYRNYETTSITNSTTYDNGHYDSSIEADIVSNRQMLQQGTYPEWDFENIWAIAEGRSYPYLQWQREPQEFSYPRHLPPIDCAAYLPADDTIEIVWSHPSTGQPDSYKVYRNDLLLVSLPGNINSYEDNEVLNFERYRYNVSAQYGDDESSFHGSLFVTPIPGGYSGGKGVPGYPYLIETGRQLEYIRFNAQARYLQITDIDLSDFEDWQPIITAGSEPLSGFRGHYDGNGYTITGLNIESPETDYVGLFGIIGSDHIKDRIPELTNIRIINTSVTGCNYVGTVAGAAYAADIRNCYAEGVVNGSGRNVGGLIGYFEDGFLEKSAAVNTVSGSDNVGGLIGYVKTTREYPVMRPATVISDSYSRGIINYKSGSNIDNIAGFIGRLYFAKIVNCYSTVGMLFGKGFIGRCDALPLSVIEKSYWDIQASTRYLSEGGEGRFTYLMVSPYGLNTYVDWDFDEVWISDEDHSVNEGYPYLRGISYVSVKDDETEWDVSPNITKLNGNYPNPFNPQTTIGFSLAETGEVLLEVFNIKGQKVATLLNDKLERGNHQVVWNGRDNNHRQVGSGVYFYRMRSADYTEVRKMIMLR